MIRGGLVGGGQAECTSLMVFAQPDGPSQVGIQKFSIFWAQKILVTFLPIICQKEIVNLSRLIATYFAPKKGEKLHHALSIKFALPDTNQVSWWELKRFCLKFHLVEKKWELKIFHSKLHLFLKKFGDKMHLGNDVFLGSHSSQVGIQKFNLSLFTRQALTFIIHHNFV